MTKVPQMHRKTVDAARDEAAFDADELLASLPHLPNLRWVQLTWAGVERMLDPALRRDYLLTNIRGVFGPLMSEYVFSYLLAHERKILSRFDAQRARQWDATLPGTLQGKTIGLVGVGSIGAHLAATAKHFGMRVHGYTRSSEDSTTCARICSGRSTGVGRRSLTWKSAVTVQGALSAPERVIR